MEEEAKLNLYLGDGREFEMTPDNATLFTFIGRLAMYDHVFLETGEPKDDDTMIGTYVFNQAEAYPQLSSFMVEYDYPMILNRRDVPQCDQDAYGRYVDQVASKEEIPDTFPDDWS